jgi:hypothetical protein
MKQLNKASENMGGLVKLWAIPKEIVTVSGTTVTVSSENPVVEMYCSPGSMGISEPPNNSRAGIFYETQVSGFVPAINSSNKAVIDEMQGRKYVVVFIDGNGQCKLAGTATNPLRCFATAVTGTDEANRAGYQVVFSGETLSPSVFITNPFVPN